MATLRVPELVPSPTQDSELLRKSFEGWGTDEKAVINVLGHRNASQRRKIKDTYQQLYNESLIDRLKDELSGDFMNAVILWTYDPPERDAKLARAALTVKKIGMKQLQIIVEIACTTSPHHLVAVRQVYCSLYECSLEETILKNVSSPLNKILVGLVSSYRYDKEAVNSNVAKSEANHLHEAIKMKKLDRYDVLWILATRNFFQLKATFEFYKQTFGKSLEEDIKKYGSGDLRSLMRMVVRCIESPEKHFAKVIKEAIEGFGTDEDSLNRAIVTRADIDMMKIRGEYFTMYKSSLDNAVIGDTSGDYQKFLMTLLGAKV